MCGIIQNCFIQESGCTHNSRITHMTMTSLVNQNSVIHWRVWLLSHTTLYLFLIFFYIFNNNPWNNILPSFQTVVSSISAKWSNKSSWQVLSVGFRSRLICSWCCREFCIDVHKKGHSAVTASLIDGKLQTLWLIQLT